MTKRHVLITGGAGFIGTRLSKKLVDKGCSVRVLDNFSSQIHNDKYLPADLFSNVEIVEGDIKDAKTLSAALLDIDCVVHLAAETGTGQSMYEVGRYFDTNVQGTAHLVDILVNNRSKFKVTNLVLASSRAIYGEGAYFCATHGQVFPQEREHSRMEDGFFEPLCPQCRAAVETIPTKEQSPLNPLSMYALTKQTQEAMLLIFARSRGINGFALRYQNVYGPGQSLKNPYTGILAVFANLARQNQVIEVYEDGQESRDFIYVDDVVDATVKSVLYEGKFIGALNVGSGTATTVLQVAEEVKRYFDSSSEIRISGAFRFGDIRHNVAEITNMKSVLDISPSIPFRVGLHHFLDWAQSQEVRDQEAYSRSVQELSSRGLMGKFNGPK